MTIRRLLLHVALASLAVPAVVIANATAVSADEHDPRDEGRDRADIGAETAELQVESVEQPAEATLAAGTAIEDFRYDRLIVEGHAGNVCHGSLRRGTAWTFNALRGRFGGSAGSMYVCRERWDVATDPDCNGTVVNPVASPGFFSTCWSNHAQGRALDLMVGRSGGGWNTARGTAIVKWLLAPDSAGNQNALARRLGVQQILFNDRCWNSDGDRGISSLNQMRRCGIGHFDHVHIDLTIAGSEGLVSYWGASSTPPAPRLDGLYLNDRDNGGWFVQKWVNLSAGTTASGTWETGVVQAVPGDWDGDDVHDDLFVFNGATGAWTLRSFSGRSQRVLSTGAWSNQWDQIVNGDFDRDGSDDDMVVLDRDTGLVEVWHWSASGPSRRGTHTWSRRWDTIIGVDWNANGTVTETLLVDRETGDWYMHSWSGARPNQLDAGRWLNGWDQFFAGDLDAQGETNDVWVRDNATGSWAIVSWFNGHGYTRASGAASTTWDQFVVGDFDTDGRTDDIFARDRRAGGWVVWSWHRYVAAVTASSIWSTRWDLLSVGVFG